MKRTLLVLLVIALTFAMGLTVFASGSGSGVSPDTALKNLKTGNARYVKGTSTHPNLNSARRQSTAKNGQFPFATIIGCSDSRAPIESIFDQGVGDLFIIRIAGNVCDTDEVGSIEYGVDHLATPLFVVMGHTGCGAVTAVVTEAELHGSIPPLVDNIIPAVETAKHEHPGVHGKALVPAAVEANVFQSIDDLLKTSEATRKRVKAGTLKIVGGVYDLASGKVKWLGQHPEQAALLASTGGGGSHGGGGHAVASSSRSSHSASGSGTVTLISASRLAELDKARHRNIHVSSYSISDEAGGVSGVWGIFLIIAVLGVIGIVTWRTGTFTNMGVAGKLYGGFGVVVLLAIIIGIGGYYFIGKVTDESHLEVAAMELDMMAGEAGKLQNEFLLVGIEDTAKGEEVLSEHNEIMVEFGTDLNNLHEMGLTKNETEAVNKLDEVVSAYETTFGEISEKYHEIEKDKEELDTLGSLVDDQLAELLYGHELELDKLEKSGASRAKVQESTHLVEKISECEVEALRLFHYEVEFLLSKHTETIKDMENHFGTLLGLLDEVEEMVHDAADIKLVEELHVELGEYQHYLEIIVEDELIVAADLVTCNEELKEFDSVAAALSHYAETQAAKAKSEANMASIILVILSAAIGSILAYVISHGITTTLKNVVANLASGSDQVSAASGQVSASSQELAESSSEQASSLEEVSSSLEEMTSMTRQNAENAGQANSMAGEMSTAAEKGSHSMVKMNEAITKIKTSSDETAKIIKTIDEIAFQTNLLALNAAVEAARAGEAGAGFAVVADEVRNLAMRAAEAAKNTSTLIEESQENADNGVAVTKEVTEVLQEISGTSEKVKNLIGEVTVASDEQTQGINQINTAISQMDKVTQTTAANAEESASASEELSSQAVELNSNVQVLSRVVGGGTAQGNGNGRALNSRSAALNRNKAGQQKPASHKILTRSTVAAGKQNILNPSDVIPLDDSDFDDF